MSRLNSVHTPHVSVHTPHVSVHTPHVSVHTPHVSLEYSSYSIRPLPSIFLSSLLLICLVISSMFGLLFLLSEALVVKINYDVMRDCERSSRLPSFPSLPLPLHFHFSSKLTPVCGKK